MRTTVNLWFSKPKSVSADTVIAYGSLLSLEKTNKNKTKEELK